MDDRLVEFWQWLCLTWHSKAMPYMAQQGYALHGTARLCLTWHSKAMPYVIFRGRTMDCIMASFFIMAVFESCDAEPFGRFEAAASFIECWENIEISKYQNIKISKYHNIKISQYHNISHCRRIRHHASGMGTVGIFFWLIPYRP